MNIRKIIREELEKINLNDGGQSEDSMNGILGAEILDYFPFSELPDTIQDVPGEFYRNGVPGWGKVRLPSIGDRNSLTTMNSKEDIIGGEDWEHPRSGHILKNPGYIELFKRANGEDPIFKINPKESWKNKIKVINPRFLEKREKHIKDRYKSLGEEKISNKIINKKTMETPEGTLFTMNIAENEHKKNHKRRN